MKKTVKIYEVAADSLIRRPNEGFYTDRENAIYAAFSGASSEPAGVTYTLKVYTLPLPLPVPYTSVKDLLLDYSLDLLDCCSAADRYCVRFIEEADGIGIDFNHSVAVRNALAKAGKARRLTW